MIIDHELFTLINNIMFIFLYEHVAISISIVALFSSSLVFVDYDYQKTGALNSHVYFLNKTTFFSISEEISTLSFMRITSVFQETTENVRVTVMPFYLKKSDYVSGFFSFDNIFFLIESLVIRLYVIHSNFIRCCEQLISAEQA